MTKETLNRLPMIYRGNIEAYKASYKRGNTADKERAFGYINALRDAGIITETERRVLISYVTV